MGTSRLVHHEDWRSFPMSKLHLSMLLGALSALALGVGGLLGCGSDDVEIASPACTGDCVCTGDACECKAGGKCAFGGSAGGSAAGADGGEGGASAAPPPDNVTFNCETKNTCDLTCGTGCTSNC